MTTFIPEWGSVAGSHVQVKRVLSALDDGYVVRRPLHPENLAADFFVTHPRKGWLALAVDETPFAELDPSQLFAPDRPAPFEKRLADLQKLGNTPDRCATVLASLALMWRCTNEQVRMLNKAYLGVYGTRLVSREQFMQLGVKLVNGMLISIPIAIEHDLRQRYFPESEIPAACTARRSFNRDNSARLQRFFLDAQQEWASKLDLDLPVQQTGLAKDFSVRMVNGVAGSGKTLIALSRAQLLARLFPRQRVLVLIYNTPVVADIKARLHRAHRVLPPNLEITTFYSWAFHQWRAVFGNRPRMADSHTVTALIEQARRQAPDLKHAVHRLISELDFINDHLIVDEAQYLEANRTGRGFALRPKERRQIWALYTEVSAALRRAGQHLWSAVPRAICLAAAAQERLHKHHHILIDEAQFFSPAQFQTVKLSTQPGGQLFLCADPNQGFMKNRLSWKSVGLDVAGRTKKLQKSYRTTKAILQTANRLLVGLGGQDDDFLAPDYADMEPGVRPRLVYTASLTDSVDRLLNELVAATQQDQLPLHDFLVICGDKLPRSHVYRRLSARLGANKVWWLNHEDQKKLPPNGYGQDYLRLAYLDTATGLEAVNVLLLGLENLFLAADATDPNLNLNPDEQTPTREESARKLYMAMTRAGQRLVLLASQPLPPALEQLFDVQR